ncbi:MAG TPA: hypothetical protein VL325_09990 [Pyrinomonadaceae bacterium]|jgi:hypothetical protein|nr:hypothetical protein [Pyrinomonadaceae bacterium]
MRTFLESFDRRFKIIHSRSSEFLSKLNNDQLFTKPRELNSTFEMFSCGEFVLRSAGAVEQTFGGIMTKLWDDPFEWTLPEKLSTIEFIREYLGEVETTRLNGFSFFKTDDDLARQIPAPDQLKPLHEILLETVARAEHYQGRAFAVFRMLSDEKLPRI